MLLVELRKNSHINKKVTPLLRLKQLKQQMEGTQLYVTFTSINKLGINPNSEYNTPLGICSYPLEYVIKHNVAGVPFAGSQDHIQVFQTTSTKIWNLGNFSPDIKDRIIQSLTKHKLTTNNTKKAKSNKRLWQGMYADVLYSFGIEPEDVEEYLDLNPDDYDDDEFYRCNTKIRRILLDAGIEVVIDPGKGILHENEPTQALFLLTKICKSVDVISNTTERDNNNKATNKLRDVIQNPQKYNKLPAGIVRTEGVYHMIDRLTTRDPKLEVVLLKFPELIYEAIIYTLNVMPRGWPELEKRLTHIPDGGYDYCMMLNKRVHECEHAIISQGVPAYVFQYWVNLVKTRWPEAEPVLQKDPKLLAMYMDKLKST